MAHLKIKMLGAMLSTMAAARFAAVLLVAFTSVLGAQSTATSRVTITTLDQIGAIISGARIGIIPLPSVIPDDGDWLRYALHASEQASTHTDGNGEATFHLSKGNYVFTITAPAFKRQFQKVEIRDESNQSVRVALAIDQGHGWPVREAEIPLESTTANVFIPLEPVQTLTLKAVWIRRR